MTSRLPERLSFGKYRPIAILGRGGMATVYLATASGPGGFTKLVVIKELRPDLADEGSFRAMFLEEARLAARLNHPNIVQTFEVVDDDDVQFIVMEYLEGQSLWAFRSKADALGGAKIAGHARIAAEMLAGLHAAHELADFDGKPLRVVHRDVSPHNVFVTYDGEIKLVDFGIAKAVDSSSWTSTGAIKGKLTYMPPEQAAGHPVDRRADVFAAGVVLYEGLTGKRIWEGLSEGAILHRLLMGEIPRVRDAAPEVPAELDRIVARALEVRPEDRYPTAAAFQDELQRYLATLPHAPTARDVGAMAAVAFTEERAQIRRVIDEQLRAGRSTAPGERSLPRLPGMVAPPSSPSAVNEGGTRSSAVVTQDVQRSAGTDKQALVVALVAVAVGAAALIVAATQVLSGRKVERPSEASSATIASTATATATSTSTHAPAPAPAATSGAGATATASPIPSAIPTASVRLTVLTRPKGAKVYVDGNLLEGDARIADLVPGGALHRVRVEAPGFVTYDESIQLESDRRLDVALRRVPGVARPGKASPDEDIGF